MEEQGWYEARVAKLEAEKVDLLALLARGVELMETTAVLGEVHGELIRARAKFPEKQSSAHEGWAVLMEEVDELWDEVKGKHPERRARMRAEAIQIAAMAVRFIEEVCGTDYGVTHES